MDEARNDKAFSGMVLKKLPVGEGSLLCHKVDGELVIYQYATDEVHQMNATARMIWESLDTVDDLEGIVDRIAWLHDVPADDVRDDVVGTVGALHETGLITAAEQEGNSDAREGAAGSSRRAFLTTGLKRVAMLTYAVPMIKTFMVGKAEAQPPSVITNDPPPPTADPVITSIDPDNFTINKKKNKNVTVEVYGYDFMDGFTASFSGSGITVRSEIYKNPNWVRVRIRVSKNSSPGAQILTITNPNTEFDTYCCFTLN